jgi:hypothetical protein
MGSDNQIALVPARHQVADDTGLDVDAPKHVALPLLLRVHHGDRGHVHDVAHIDAAL